MIDALIYTSIAEPELTDTELEVILLKSRARNSVRGVTGALLKRDGCIVQYLEGEPDQLEHTFARIAASPLHRDVEIAARAANVERVFDRWHMGFRDFQSMHGRGDATDALASELPRVRAQAQHNTPAHMLVDWWNRLGESGRA